MTEAEIINGLLENTTERNRYENGLYSMFNYFIREGCTKYNLSEDDSFSAYSDAVLSVIINIANNRFDGKSSVKTYLFQIFSNKCVDLVRKNTTNKNSVHQGRPISDFLYQLPDSAKSIVERLTQKYQASVIAEKLKVLGEKCKEMLLLFEEGFSDREIAERLQYQSAAVAKTSRLRCFEKLREKVKEAISA